MRTGSLIGGLTELGIGGVQAVRNSAYFRMNRAVKESISENPTQILDDLGTPMTRTNKEVYYREPDANAIPSYSRDLRIQGTGDGGRLSADEIANLAQTGSRNRRVWFGHGEYNSSNFVVPDNMQITVYGKAGDAITNRLGLAVAHNIELGPDIYRKTYSAGQRMPNLRLLEPGRLTVGPNTITVEQATNLSVLANRARTSNSPSTFLDCHWAACLSLPSNNAYNGLRSNIWSGMRNRGFINDVNYIIKQP